MVKGGTLYPSSPARLPHLDVCLFVCLWTCVGVDVYVGVRGDIYI
jgi:hypothetical protein